MKRVLARHKAHFLVTRRRYPRRTVPGGDQPVNPHPWRQVLDQRGEDGAVGPVQPGPRTRPAQHGDLMPQHEQLRILGCGGPAEQDQPAAEPHEDEIEKAHRHESS